MRKGIAIADSSASRSSRRSRRRDVRSARAATQRVEPPEAPLISEDPSADNTDLYAFVSPDKTNTVTFVANYIPLEAPAAGRTYTFSTQRPLRDQDRHTATASRT